MRQLKKRTSLLAVLITLFSFSARSEAIPPNWLPFGPDGGDARSFAVDPHDNQHLYLGTAVGWIYESHNGGGEWKRLARIGNRDDLVLDNIIIDPSTPKRILVGAWVLGSTDGGLFVSSDGGASWNVESQMKGQSIRALVNSPSDPKVFVTGTLKGVYKSVDSGATWKLISPEGSTEIHEVESIAIDPKDPKIIYAGTWHLPWKTTDDGANWSNIKEGVIDDSDVFSIIIDPKDPNVVYASACSGIYKSETAGGRFQKIQGIPSTARRTRVLMQDPQHQNIVFAGTTEGLYRTSDSGKTWIRTTGPELIVNDVFINPADTNRILLATDRGGVLVSNDGGASFRSTNTGFSSRQITSYVEDMRQPGTIYVGMVNDKAWGGAFVSTNGGLTWTQKNGGLDAHDVLSLGQGPDGTILAGTRHGIYRLNGELWNKVDRVSLELPVTEEPPVAKPVVVRKKGAAARKVTPKAPVKKKPAPKPFDGSVFAFTRDGQQIFAGTQDGILKSVDGGLSWNLTADPQGHVWSAISSSKSTILAASLSKASLTTDDGRTWTAINPPSELTQITAVAVDGFGGLWIGGREGVYLSEDKGTTWQVVKNLFVRDVNSIFYDEKGQRVLITANSPTTIAFSAHLPDKTVSYWNTGWNLRLLRPVGEHMVGATLYDGVVIQPEMVNSTEVAKH
ncbi:WD40/YVTN/BNR-like repeat-containing protein [Edaphobacter modestus]|uniref:Photosystem II stability/assembly factor-like uncharacterized protein n=1 Tax=Edaphobacter modestus TaxID=388466 RepID=A0A4Q7YT00_9BACT|nr:hypothetical protein [Edaphobacter modestus]RZU39995.1 photosystem II stability/assembly factor-like uncharacterized protein [Edaphobacter modestus]